MGMTDGQVKMHLRMLIKMINEANEEQDREAISKKLEALLDLLQTALEDL